MSKYVTIDGNEAAARIAFKTSEVIAIYPITPSSPMGELSDEWASRDAKNIWGATPLVVELQSEGGAAGACHGALQAGALTTTFTASQGLLLMVPNMFKIAGELTSAVFHVSARSIAAQALSIFGDHSDVMACRTTGWAMLFGNSVQEVMDFALIAQSSTLRSRVPFINIFDGFRTSHEVSKIEEITDEQIRRMVDDELVREHRRRALSPDNPVIRGTAQNPDVYFQARETVNSFYDVLPKIVQEEMDKFGALTGRRYKLFDYVGSPEAERVVVLMGSGADTADETVELLVERGERVGLVKVRLYRPFDCTAFLDALPPTVKAISVLDRTKEPGGAGEPLYQDVLTALMENQQRFKKMPKVVGGRYGLSSKEFTPAMCKAVLDDLKKPEPKNHFTIGIFDDVTHTSLEWDPNFTTESDDVTTAIFWGLGSDGTVGANKNSIKIIGEETQLSAQGYFVYDSKKSGSVTVSHLRFGHRPIKRAYLVTRANFTAIHQFGLLYRYPVLDQALPHSTVLINSPYGPEGTWDELPAPVQREILHKKLRVFVVDGNLVARETGMGGRINTIMQTAFFALSEILPKDEAIAKIKDTIYKTYGRRGQAVVDQNYAAVDKALESLAEMCTPTAVTSTTELLPPIAEGAPPFVQDVTAMMVAGKGDFIPTSKLPVDGTYPVGTSQWEKRCISNDGPIWDQDICIQCGKCVLVCPHGVIRAKVVAESDLKAAPEGFRSSPAKFKVSSNERYTIQRSLDDCTGCAICVEVCPAKNKSMASRKALYMEDITAIRDRERAYWKFFEQLPDEPKVDEPLNYATVKNVQLLRPLFQFSGACAGCGETPYVGLLSRLFGDRAIIANATGCSSIYGGNLPTTPYCANSAGRGPAWSNSLFEDNAEFGMGMRLAIDTQREYAKLLMLELDERIGLELVAKLSAPVGPEGWDLRREEVAELKHRLSTMEEPQAKELLAVADTLIDRSVWIVGGDGWAYDIGFGGLDHVMASGRNVNVLVLDTEVYSNTGGQASKATGRGAVAKFAAGGKEGRKKDLGLMAMSYGNVYVATVAMGSNDAQCVKAFVEAEAHPGPSIIIAYSHCIAHGIDMMKGMTQQKLAVDSGYWPLYRYNPELGTRGKNPFKLDSRSPSIALEEYLYSENRYRMLRRSSPKDADRLLELAKQDVLDKIATYERLAMGKGD